MRPGDLVPAGRIVITMLETSQLWVKVYVPETDLASVRLGQHAQVEVDSVRRPFLHGPHRARSLRRLNFCLAMCRRRATVNTRSSA